MQIGAKPLQTNVSVQTRDIGVDAKYPGLQK